MQEQLAGVLIGVATRQIAQLITDDFLQADPGLGSKNVTSNVRDRLESVFPRGGPDLHSLSIPTEELLVRTKEDALGSGQRLPYIGKPAIFRRHFVEERNKLQRTRSIRRQVTEF